MKTNRHDPLKFRFRYILNVKTSANAVEITADRFLVIGTEKGELLMFSFDYLDQVKAIPGEKHTDGTEQPSL